MVVVSTKAAVGMKTKLILGPPGTGKTSYLIGEAQKCPSFVYVAFTRKAAMEAASRAGELPGGDFRTIHSLVYRGLGIQAGSIMTWSDYKMIGNALGMRFSYSISADESAGGGTEGDQIRSLVDYAAAIEKDPEELAYDFDIWRLRRYVSTLAQYKADTGKYDFNDILVRGAREVEPLNISTAIIDEAQDLSTLQWRVITRLFSDVDNLLIAGDDDQAIFRWAGADVPYFLGLGQGAEIVALEQSHRVPKSIHEFANKITGQIEQRYAKTWKPISASPGTVYRVGAPEYVDLSNVGTYYLLARNNYLLAEWEDVCRIAGVTYTIRGKRSVDKLHLRAIRAYGAMKRGDSVLSKDKKLVHEYSATELTFEKDWFDTLLGIPTDDANYYRAILRRGRDLDAEPRFTISTIHGVKGGEADHVAILSDWSTSTDKAFEVSQDDEHRVFYVGATRAKQTLTLVAPQDIRSYQFPT